MTPNELAMFLTEIKEQSPTFYKELTEQFKKIAKERGIDIKKTNKTEKK